MSKRLFLCLLALLFLTTPTETKAQTLAESLLIIALHPLKKLMGQARNVFKLPNSAHKQRTQAPQQKPALSTQPAPAPSIQAPKPATVRRIPEADRRVKSSPAPSPATPSQSGRRLPPPPPTKTSKVTRDSITVTRKADAKKVTMQLITYPIEEYTKALKAFTALRENRPTQSLFIADLSGTNLIIYRISPHEVSPHVYLKDVTNEFDISNLQSQPIEDRSAINPIHRPVIKLQSHVTDKALLECYTNGLFGMEQLFLRDHKFLGVENITIPLEGRNLPSVLIKDLTSQIVSETPASLSFE